MAGSDGPGLNGTPVPGRTDDARAELASVLERARAGSDVAFEAVFHELSPAVAGYLRLNGVAEVDELTNEVFAQVHRGLHRFAGEWGGFRSWVFTIAHHRMVDEARRAKRRPQLALADVAEEAATGDVESEALDSLSDERLHRLLAVLSEDQRRVLLLRVVADLPLEEAAAALGKTVGAVKSLQHRALAALRRALEQEGAEHGS
jgi:RNA polymerase sigma-70 factor (ECF subfamily)